jgi:hypothetical protein
MNFKDFLHEMTFSAGQQDFAYEPDFSQAQKIGELNGYDILHNDLGYCLSKDGKVYTWILIQGEEIQAVRTIPEARKQHLAENLLFWLKSYLNKSLVFGRVMSNDAIAWIKMLANSGRFNMFWLNIKTKERQPYNSAEDRPNLKPFRSLATATDWRVFIEAYDGDFFHKTYSEWNKLKAVTDLFA